MRKKTKRINAENNNQIIPSRITPWSPRQNAFSPCPGVVSLPKACRVVLSSSVVSFGRIGFHSYFILVVFFSFVDGSDFLFTHPSRPHSLTLLSSPFPASRFLNRFGQTSSASPCFFSFFFFFYSYSPMSLATFPTCSP